MLITDNETLRRFIPNVMREAVGETPLYEKMEQYLAVAEAALTRRVLGAAFLAEIAAPVYAEIADFARRAVGADAFLRALPMLDVVLTPNGFGVVNTDKLAAASLHRTEALRDGLIRFRDESIEELIFQLRHCESNVWHTSLQADTFASTLFPSPSVALTVSPDAESMFIEYLRLIPKLRAMGDALAAAYFSPELVARLRRAQFVGRLTPKERELTEKIKELIIARCTGAGPYRTPDPFDIVQFIRDNPEEFPDWHNSRTALLFAPPVFSNRPRSAGYFF